MEIIRTEQEVRDMLSRMRAPFGPEGEKYEQGVRAALEWILGITDNPPDEKV